MEIIATDITSYHPNYLNLLKQTNRERDREICDPPK
jgi:hypothetical protein